MKIVRLPAALAAASVVLVAYAGLASADMIDDWLAHKNAALEPAVSYTGDPFELKFSHPAPPASVVPPVWQATFDWLSEATNGKLTFKQFGAGALVGVRDGFKGVGAGISNYGTCYAAFEGRGNKIRRSRREMQSPTCSTREFVASRSTRESAESPPNPPPVKKFDSEKPNLGFLGICENQHLPFLPSFLPCV